MNIPAIITTATLTRVETNFLEYVYFIDAGMPYVTMLMLEFTNDLFTSIQKIFVFP